MDSISLIIDAVCAVAGVSKKKLLSPNRSGPVFFARMLAVRFLCERGETHSTIGWLLNRSRATITCAKKASDREYETNKAFRWACDRVSLKLQNYGKSSQPL